MRGMKRFGRYKEERRYTALFLCGVALATSFRRRLHRHSLKDTGYLAAQTRKTEEGDSYV